MGIKFFSKENILTRTIDCYKIPLDFFSLLQYNTTMITEFPVDMPLAERRALFLDDLVAYYSEDTSRRAFDKTTEEYFYRSEDGSRCAIGRYISDDVYGSNNLEGHTCDTLLGYLPSYIAALGGTFLRECQILHDKNEHWDEKGLTALGATRVEYIKSQDY